MSQSASLRMELKPSSLLAGTLAVVHLLALVASAAVLSGWPLILVGAGVLISAAVTVAQALHRTSGSARALELHADGQCRWRDGKGRWHEAQLQGQQFVSPRLVVLALKGNALRRNWIVLPPGSCDAESARRLRGWLRWRTEMLRRDSAPEISGSSTEK